MTLRQVLKYFGSRSLTAHALGISSQAVSQWHANGCVPIGMQYRLEIETAGKLKANRRHLKSNNHKDVKK